MIQTLEFEFAKINPTVIYKLIKKGSTTPFGCGEWLLVCKYDR